MELSYNEEENIHGSELLPPYLTGAKRREWIEVAGIIINSDEMDHSRKFPTFSTSKIKVSILSWG